MRIMSVCTSFGGLEKTGGFAQTIVMSNNPKVDDPWWFQGDEVENTISCSRHYDKLPPYLPKNRNG